MGKKEMLLDELKQIPEPLLEEVWDFVQFLKSKASQEKIDISLASESSLKKDWLDPKEDEAWRDL